jgi:hypothetical protein
MKRAAAAEYVGRQRGLAGDMDLLRSQPFAGTEVHRRIRRLKISNVPLGIKQGRCQAISCEFVLDLSEPRWLGCKLDRHAAAASLRRFASAVALTSASQSTLSSIAASGLIHDGNTSGLNL